MALGETFKPGLFDIGLNIEKKISNHDLLIFSKQMYYHVEFKPRQVKPAIYNLLAVVSFHMDSGRTEARLMLESLIIEYPQDLNILADIIYIYKQMGCEKDSNSYKEKLNELKENKLLQARSLLAQANAINYDLTADYYRTHKLLLEDIQSQLSIEYKHVEQVDKAKDIVVDAHNMVNRIPGKAYDKVMKAKEISIEMFERGIKMLKKLDCSNEEILIWKHNLANVRGKLEIIRHNRNENPEGRIENYIKALDAHLDVINHLSTNEKPLKIYVARSNIFFAQLSMSRKSVFDNIELPQGIMSKNLDSMWRTALSICPNDQTVLQRCGRYEINRGEYSRAISHLNHSINLQADKDINWFSYSSRSQAYLFYYKSELSKMGCDKAQNFKYLVLAYNDMKLCIKSKCTSECMTRMANLCFRMSEPFNTGIDFRCENVEYIFEALEIIHEAFNKRGISNYSKIHLYLGECYLYINEYRKAIEALKSALELNEWSQKFPKVFSLLSKGFVALYKRNNNKNLLSEFRYMLKIAKNKHHDKWVTNAMDLMCRNPKMLTDLIKNMIEWDVRGCNVLINEALQKLYFESIGLCEYLRSKFEEKLERRNFGVSKTNGPTEIQKPQITNNFVAYLKNFEYDFYVSHSEKDKDWVNCMLLPQLEEFDEEIKFKGFIPSRDFVPGNNVINSMLEGIKQSYKLLIVLTPNYLRDNWQMYVKDLMIYSVIEAKMKKKTIIPIILESCEIPHEIQNFSPISFTLKSDWVGLRSCLTFNIDPERQEETGRKDGCHDYRQY